MKTLALLLFLLPSVALAQTYHRVVYAPFQIATDTTVNYDGNNTTQPDSVWSALLSTGKIAGAPVHRAYLLESSSLSFASSAVVKHYENNSPAPFSFLVPATAGHGTDFLRGDLTWQTPTGTASISNDSTNASGDTIKIGTAQVQFFWIQYNSPGHYYINPGTQADAGKIIHIIALSAHADTVTALTDGYNANGSAQDATIGNGTPAIGSALVLDCGIDGHLIIDGATKNTLAP